MRGRRAEIDCRCPGHSFANSEPNELTSKSTPNSHDTGIFAFTNTADPMRRICSSVAR